MHAGQSQGTLHTLLNYWNFIIINIITEYNTKHVRTYVSAESIHHVCKYMHHVAVSLAVMVVDREVVDWSTEESGLANSPEKTWLAMTSHTPSVSSASSRSTSSMMASLIL